MLAHHFAEKISKICLQVTHFVRCLLVYNVHNCHSLQPKTGVLLSFVQVLANGSGRDLAHLKLSFKPTKIISNLISILSLISIMITVFLINDKSLFPGFWALIPTLATACINQTQNNALLNSHFLSAKPLVFLGKMSYSLYLWHWPLLVFSHTFYPPGSESIFANTSFILLLCFVLSYLTYFFVENPIRKTKRNKITVGIIFLAMNGIGIFSIVFGAVGHLTMDNAQAQAYFKKVDLEMRPRPDEDFVTINATQHPNFSKSSNRLKPTVQKLKASKLDLDFDYMNGIEFFLQKRIDQHSIFYEPNRPQMTEYNVLNQGQQNKLLVIGDSHAMRLSYRFQQLHIQSVQKQTEHEMPTVVGMYHSSYSLDNSTADFINFGLRLVEKHKIKRVFMACHWLVYWCSEFDSQSPSCRLDQMRSNIEEMLAFVRKFQTLGAEVSVLGIDIQSSKMQFDNMYDFTGVIEKNIQPFSLKWFKAKFNMIIEPYEKAMRDAGLKLMDLTDNLCWEDRCYVTSPMRYTPYTDGGHLGKFYARHWLSVLDGLVRLE